MKVLTPKIAVQEMLLFYCATPVAFLSANCLPRGVVPSSLGRSSSWTMEGNSFCQRQLQKKKIGSVRGTSDFASKISFPSSYTRRQKSIEIRGERDAKEFSNVNRENRSNKCQLTRYFEAKIDTLFVCRMPVPYHMRANVMVRPKYWTSGPWIE